MQIAGPMPTSSISTELTAKPCSSSLETSASAAGRAWSAATG